MQLPRYTRACMYKWGMGEEESPDAEFIRDLQDFFLPYSTADADQEVVLDLTLQYFTLLRICYKITQVIWLIEIELKRKFFMMTPVLFFKLKYR